MKLCHAIFIFYYISKVYSLKYKNPVSKFITDLNETLEYKRVLGNLATEFNTILMEMQADYEANIADIQENIQATYTVHNIVLDDIDINVADHKIADQNIKNIQADHKATKQTDIADRNIANIEDLINKKKNIEDLISKLPKIWEYCLSHIIVKKLSQVAVNQEKYKDFRNEISDSLYHIAKKNGTIGNKEEASNDAREIIINLITELNNEFIPELFKKETRYISNIIRSITKIHIYYSYILRPSTFATAVNKS